MVVGISVIALLALLLCIPAVVGVFVGLPDWADRLLVECIAALYVALAILCVLGVAGVVS